MLSGEKGSILAFLPARRRSAAWRNRLDGLPPDTDLHLLYGDLPSAAQDAAIAPSPAGRRKVVLSTALAESSLTIEDVRMVVDAGAGPRGPLQPCHGDGRAGDGTGYAGRSGPEGGTRGRAGPGLCCRLWHAGDMLLPHPRPEIQDARSRPSAAGHSRLGCRPEDLPWLTPPPVPALDAARRTLIALGAAKEERGRMSITPHGEHMARLPLHPRLSHMVLRAGAQNAALLPAGGLSRRPDGRTRSPARPGRSGYPPAPCRPAG